MGRNLTGWLGLGVAAVVALQSAHAEERKAAAGRPGGSTHRLPAAARAGAQGDNSTKAVKVQRPGEAPVFAMTPLAAKLPQSGAKASTRGEVPGEKGPTPPQERKSITFFRFDPKFGDISVQPVVGGVNGAQISVGF